MGNQTSETPCVSFRPFQTARVALVSHSTLATFDRCHLRLAPGGRAGAAKGGAGSGTVFPGQCLLRTRRANPDVFFSFSRVVLFLLL